MVSLINNLMEQIDLTMWWESTDNAWKKIFRNKLNISSEPTLTELEQLILSEKLYCVLETEIKDLKPLEVFCRLTKVELMGAKNIQSVLPLINNVDLRYLNIADTKVTNIEILSRFSKLEELFLSDYIVNLDDIANLTNLRRLFFRTSKGIETLEALTNLTQLEELVISDSVTNLKPIDHLSKIKRLVGFGISTKEENRYRMLHPHTELNCGGSAKKKMNQMLTRIDKIDISKL